MESRGKTSSVQLVVNLCACFERSIGRRGAVKDTREQIYAAGGVRSSSAESASRTGIRIITLVEKGRVEYVLSGPLVSAFKTRQPARLSGPSKKENVTSSSVKKTPEIRNCTTS